VAKIAHQPWLDQRELHRRWWVPVIDTLNFFRLAPNGLARALEWLSTTRGVDTSELQSWDDLAAWFETHIRMVFNPPNPPVTERPMTRLEFLDSELAWKIRAGKCSGPPPRPKEKPPDCNQRGLDFPIRGSKKSPEFNCGSEKIQPEFFGRGICAPNFSERLTLDDFADLKFAWQISRLAKRGERALYEFFSELSAKYLLRTPVEKMLHEFFGDHGEGGR
jgi:hypothetical protein